MSGFRLSSGGHVDRSREITFTYNGKTMTGLRGDTLASALVANGVGAIARSFKYHRPRGIYAAGLEDPNSMLAVTSTHGHDPAIRAGQVVLSEGLLVQSVTGWPSPTFDVVAPFSQVLSNFLTAGFYYKTLKWPNWSWYEEGVRKMAGYGAPRPEQDSRLRAHRNDACDVLIIGAGPAGLAAAMALTGTDLNIVLVDQEPEVGGSLRWESTTIQGKAGHEWAKDTVATFQAAGGRYLCSTCVTGAYEGDYFTLLQSFHDEEGVSGEQLWKLHARHVVMATGAVDRPLVLQNNDRPGVMLSAAVRRYISEYGVSPGKRVVIAACDDSAYLTAMALAEAGLESPLLVDSRLTPPTALCSQAEKAGVEVLKGSQVTNVLGRQRVQGISISDANGATRQEKCDVLALAGGVTPLVHLAAHRGMKPRYDQTVAAFVCPDLPDRWHIAGAVSGSRDLHTALVAGTKAANDISGLTTDAPAADTLLQVVGGEPVWQAKSGMPAKMFVDLQNDVKASDVALAARENYVSVEHLKRYTTLGMGTDQGRTSNVNGLAILAAQTGRQMNEVGTTTFRPPYTATRMGAIAHYRQGDGNSPRRRLPAHKVNVAYQAQFEDFGWARADWYASNGPDRETAITEEMRTVRESVGVYDASPLGKIEIAGPDAREFVNKFYVSNLKGLKPGRIRYSVMLHDDGIIFDDGVIACIDDNLFLAGPTSGNAEVVAGWFERWRQTEWPDMRVSVSPITSNWAVIAIAGPQARELLLRLEPDFDISTEAFPHMHFREAQLSGVPARISRVSFTGELQYEVAVPARYGADLLQRALTLGADLGAQPIGMEAWLRLRLEKGYLHLGADTNGRTTPLDIGMGGVVAKKTYDYIGKRALSLPFNQADNREELVGLKPLQGEIEIGGRILAPGADAPPCETIGYVSSAATTQHCGNIGMALIEAGSKRQGDTVSIFSNGRIAKAEICSPVFIDPENKRLLA